MAALLMRQVVLFVQSRAAAVLAVLAATAEAAGTAAPAEADIETPSPVHAGSFAWLANGGGVAPTVRDAGVQVGVACSVLLPVWAGSLALKVCLGYGIRRFVQWYNQYYDRTFMRLFKAKR